MKSIGRHDMPNFSVIATCLSENHNYRVAKNLLTAVEKLKIK